MANSSFENFKKNAYEYKKVIGIIVVIFTFILISYFISENYRIKSIMTDMKIYNGFMQIVNTDFNSKDDDEEYKLADYYIASSFRSVTGRNQRYDYCSTKILKKILKEGARFIWLDVFNSDLSSNPMPVVGSGIGKGNWILSLNTIPFDECCETIAKTAFTSGKVNNYKDPLIIALNLNTQKNLYSLNKMKDSIIKHLGERLLSVHYGYSKTNIGEVPINKLKEKVIIFTSGGFETTTLEELVNYSWDKKFLKNINYKAIDPNTKETEFIKEDTTALKDFNTNHLTIVTPDPETIFSRQYDPIHAWKFGCQFVSMYYQNIDKLIQQNAEKFKTNSFILKPPLLRTAGYSAPNILELQQAQDENKSKDSKFGKCSLSK